MAALDPAVVALFPALTALERTGAASAVDASTHTRVCAATRRLGEDIWSATAWNDIFVWLKTVTPNEPIDDSVSSTSSSPAPRTSCSWADIRSVYDTLTHMFPAAGHVWCAYAGHALRLGHVADVEQVLGKCLLTCADVRVWQFYVSFVRERKLNPARTAVHTHTLTASGTHTGAADPTYMALLEAVLSAHAEVTAAFEFAVQHVGMAYQSGGLWTAFLDHVSENPWAGESMRTDAARGVYERALGIPHDKVESMWDAYVAFEQKHSPAALAAQRVSKLQVAVGTARGVARERATLWAAVQAACGADCYAGDPGVSTSAAAFGAAARPVWRRLIAYELSNPAGLPRDVHADVLRLHFRQATAALRFCPDFWHDWGCYEVDAALVASNAAAGTTHAAITLSATELAPAIEVYTKGCAAMPDSILLAFAAAAMLELHGHTDKASQRYENCIDQLENLASSSRHSPEPLTNLRRAAAATAAATSVTFADDAVCAAGRTSLPAVYMEFQRFKRRTAGRDAARAVFTQARKSAHVTPSVYFHAAQLEFYMNKELSVAQKILEAGRKRYPADLPYILSCLDFLTAVDDTASVRSNFEAVLSELPPALSRPVWDRYIAFELRRVAGGGSAHIITSLESRRAAAHPALVGASVPLLQRLVHRWAHNGRVPCAAVDTSFARIHPYDAVEVLPSRQTPPGTDDTTTDLGVTALWSAATGRAAAGMVDGVFLQALPNETERLSHVPFWRVEELMLKTAPSRTAATAASKADDEGSGNNATFPRSPALRSLLSRLPAFDPAAPAGTAKPSAELLKSIASEYNRWVSTPAPSGLAGKKRRLHELGNV